MIMDIFSLYLYHTRLAYWTSFLSEKKIRFKDRAMPKRPPTDRLIHLHIELETHREVKMRDASANNSIQNPLEDMIWYKCRNIKSRNLKP
jgi:hypothetical protein